MSSPFSRKTNPARVRELMNFAGGASDLETSIVDLQSRGVAALHNHLCGGRRFTYLADEVGMGKTYQALGLASIVWAQKPNARVVFVSPKANLQGNWEREFHNFYRDKYRASLGVGRRRVTGQSALNGYQPDNLREFAVGLRLPARHAYFLRISSFTRPIAVRLEDTAAERREKWLFTRFGTAIPAQSSIRLSN